jgi:hypothetical protein
MEGMKVACFYTAARYENVFCRNMIEKALAEMGLRLAVSQGVFYGQCMQLMFEEMVDKADVFLTVDGDSVFTGSHINQLLATLNSDDSIDAVASMQARRGAGEVLFTADQAGDCQVDLALPLKVRTAHFGLTALRTAALKKVAKPWFWSKPNDEGGWKRMTNKIDDDIWFWRQWEAAGNSLYVDLNCRIGHVEEMVSVWDVEGERMAVKHMYPADWRQANGY